MSTSANSLAPALSQASKSPHGKGSCKSCGSDNLVIKLEPPHYALRCQACGAWVSWIRKSEARRVKAAAARSPVFNVEPKPYQPVLEAIGPAVDAPNGDLAARVERLEKTIAGHDRELTIVLKAIWACGVLQPKPGAPGVAVDDELVGELGRELAEDEAGR